MIISFVLFFVSFFVFFIVFAFLCILCQFVVARKKGAIFFIMAFQQSGCKFEDLAVPLLSLRAAFFTKNDTIRSPFCFFVYLVVSINKLELDNVTKRNI